MTESWLLPLASFVAGIVGAFIVLAFRSGRNVVLMEDFKELERQVSADRHTARSNLDQRTAIFQEKVEEVRNKFDGKVDAVRDKFDLAMERIHTNETRVTRIEAKMNGAK